MAEIVQVLGFEATAAINTLASLNGALRKVNTSIRAMNKAVAGSTGLNTLSSNLNRVNASAKLAGNNMASFGNKASSGARKATAAANSLTVSWGTMARIVGTQIVVRGISALQQALGDAADRTKEFETATLRAALVSDEGVEGVDNLRIAFNNLTIATGRSIEEINEATTEALQKDLGSTKDTIDLLTGAADDLARITGTSLTSAVNSISSVMKAFNLDLSEANNIADTFFVTIDKGDIKLSEIESRLGTVNPIIATLGGNFEDAAGAAAALTLSGLNTQTAMTQLRNVVNKLIRPTEDMEKVFEALGVTTGTELIPKFGSLEGVLKALSKEVGKDREKFGDLFNTIRGLLGVLTLTGNEGKILEGVMEAMGEKAGKAAEGADALKNTLSFVQDVKLETLKREIDTLGPALNEVKLGAIIFATNFLELIKEMGAATVDFRDKITTNIGGAFDLALNAAGATSVATIQRLDDQRVKIIKESAEKSKNALVEAKNEIDLVLARDRNQAAQAGFNEQELANLDNFVEKLRESAHQGALLNEQITFTKSKIDANTAAQAVFAQQVGIAEAEEGKSRDAAERRVKRLTELNRESRDASAEELEIIKSLVTQEAKLLTSEIQTLDLSEESLVAQGAQLEATKNVIENREALLKLEAASGKNVAEQEAIKQQAIDGTIQKLGIEIPAATQKATDGVLMIPNPFVDPTQTLGALDRIEQKAIQVAAAVARIGAGAGAVTAYHGGQPVYRAHGGRGQDTQPAMLSKGEFVTNARSAAKFFPQLQAMNSGQKPAFREQGGGVTVGDVNVNVTGGSGSESPEALGRTIANSLRRELRRKTSAL